MLISAYELEPPQPQSTHQRALRSLLDGLEKELVGTVTDEQHMLSREQIAPLRERAKVVVDLDESWGVDARYAIQSALVYVDHLRDIVDETVAEDAILVTSCSTDNPCPYTWNDFVASAATCTLFGICHPAGRMRFDGSGMNLRTLYV